MVVAQTGKIRVHAPYAREYESKQRTTAVTGASGLCFRPRGRISMSEKNFFDAATAEFLLPEVMRNYSVYRYTATHANFLLLDYKKKEGKKEEEEEDEKMRKERERS